MFRSKSSVVAALRDACDEMCIEHGKYCEAYPEMYRMFAEDGAVQLVSVLEGIITEPGNIPAWWRPFARETYVLRCRLAIVQAAFRDDDAAAQSLDRLGIDSAFFRGVAALLPERKY